MPQGGLTRLPRAGQRLLQRTLRIVLRIQWHILVFWIRHNGNMTLHRTRKRNKHDRLPAVP